MTYQNGYHYLEWRPDVLGRQGPRIKGTNIIARIVAAQFHARYKGDYERIAKDRGLPVEAIREAVDWFDKNPDIAEADAALERRVLGIEK